MSKNKYIDHTLLKPESTPQDIEKLCLEAKEYDFASVCIQPCYVKMAYGLLKETDVKVCTVIGFPLGANTTETKIQEACQAVEEGAEEIDMVINIGALKAGDTVYVTEEIRRIKEAVGEHILKVIIETCLLTDEEKVLACQCAVNAGADFVKTSTGFSKGGATVEDVRLMKQTVGDRCRVKASGGIRTPEDFNAMIEAGAARIGTSSGIKLICG
ncbi:MAG: deoxyribose-phosphate aldolase [Solobacterium sp.]|nr:deoxyribose-phosphate aldolase [Solobacterium sp.]